MDVSLSCDLTHTDERDVALGGPGALAHSVRCLSCKYEDLNSIFRLYIKIRNSAWWHTFVIQH